MLHALIMAGGGGTRFWPRSRQRRPKQFLPLKGDRSLLQLAVDRIESLIPLENTWIITAEAYREETSRQVPSLSPEQIIGEPCGRDTAPCIGLGAALIAQRDPDGVMLVMPADHVIEPVQEFCRSVHVARQIIEEQPDALCTFGIPPNFPATGYGYIQRGSEMAHRQGVAIYRVKAFREKPGLELAERFFQSGEYYWNSGIFVWKAATILKELNERKPLVVASINRIVEASLDKDRKRIFQEAYEGMERVSIDYAVMENARNVLVIHSPFQWDDVGSWLALERMNPQDVEGNTILARHLGLRTKQCVIVGDSDRLITTIGVKNLLIVQDGNATLVADRHDEAAVKKLVEMLGRNGLETYL